MLNKYLSDMPLLHSWDGGKTWNTGGFDRDILTTFHRFIAEGADILETGAGNSTIFFLIHKPRQLVSIAPQPDTFERIYAYCDDNGIDRSPLRAYVDYSEWVLPALAKDQQFDFVLIDGGHGWPTVFVDFCYANAMLRNGGFLVVDDTNLHSVKELGRLLTQQPEFQLVTQDRKTAVFRKLAEVRCLGDWWTEPYIIEKTNDSANLFDLDGDRSPMRRWADDLEDELTSIKAELASIRSSRSWRITAPLRRMVTIMRKALSYLPPKLAPLTRG